MKYIILIGDVVNSRSIPDRKSFQERFRDILEELNDRNTELLSPYTITLGDEFQAVYSAAGNLFIDLFGILAAIYPHKIRFSISIGNLTTPINPVQAIGMDGPAFHLARAGITYLKKTPYFFHISTVSPDKFRLANLSLQLISHEIAGWEKNRFIILNGLLRRQPVKAIAANLRISTVAVYKNIHAGALNTIREISAEISHEINIEMETNR